MTKLGKMAAKAVAVTCLTGCFYLANPCAPTVNAQQISAISVKYTAAAEMLQRTASGESVNLNGNRDVAGLAAVVSGDLEISAAQGETQDAAADGNQETAGTVEAVKDVETTDKSKKNNQEAEAAQNEVITLTAKVENSLNIRKKPDEDSDIVGKLFRGCTAEITGEKGNWYEITSGDVTGWVSKDYALTGEEAEDFLKEADPVVATVTASSLNLRKSAGTDSDVVSVLKEGTSYMVLSEGKEWVQIRYTTNLEGYVSAEYINLENKAGEAVSMETLTKYESMAAEKEAEREAARKAAAEKAASQSSGSSGSSSSGSSSSYSADSDDVTLLAALCEYEAGTNYENCLAVANVVLNRVRSSSYPNSIYGVIYQKGQFGTVTSGALNRFLSGPSSTCIKAAKAALAGENNIGQRVQFRAVWATSPSAHSNSVVIGDNIFF